MFNYQPIRYTDVVHVEELYTVHYFHFEPSHQPILEAHDFSELVYIDRNSAYVCTSIGDLRVDEGEMIVLAPGLEHGIRGNGKKGANIGVVSFKLREELPAIYNRVLAADAVQRDLLRAILQEGYASFGVQLDQSHARSFAALEQAPLGGVQLIRLYVEQLLIHMLRSEQSCPENRIAKSQRALTPDDMDVLQKVTEYMRFHLDGALSFSDIRKMANTSATVLRSLFRDRYGMSPMGYYRVLRIEEAKRLMRERKLNMTEIAELLGFSSVNYFSSCFKQEVGMTPTQYVNSIHPEKPTE